MQRRVALRNLAVAAGGLLNLPAWANGWNQTTVESASPFLSTKPADALAAMVDTLIPATDTPGAKELAVPQFIQKMVADCYDQAAQDNVKKGLAALDELARQTYNKPFADGDAEQRTALLTRLAQTTDADQKTFYALVKGLTIRGYTTSEYVMTNLMHFEPTPGYYHGCVPVKAKTGVGTPAK